MTIRLSRRRQVESNAHATIDLMRLRGERKVAGDRRREIMSDENVRYEKPKPDRFPEALLNVSDAYFV